MNLSLSLILNLNLVNHSLKRLMNPMTVLQLVVKHFQKNHLLYLMKMIPKMMMWKICLNLEMLSLLKYWMFSPNLSRASMIFLKLSRMIVKVLLMILLIHLTNILQWLQINELHDFYI